MERIREAIQRAKRERQSHVKIPESSGLKIPGAVPATSQAEKTSLGGTVLPTNARHLENCRVLIPQSNSAYLPAFDMLRTKITQQMNANNWQVILVTSPTSGCGKTVSTINLALSIARQPAQHVCVIDLDLRKPKIAYDLGVTPKYELQHVLTGEVSVEEALFCVDIGGPRISFLATTKPLMQPTEVLLSKQMKDTMHAIRNATPRPLIIVDMPPILLSDDVLAFLPQVDCCVLIVAESQSTLKEIEKSEVLLENTNFLGCVLTKSMEKVQSYY